MTTTEQDIIQEMPTPAQQMRNDWRRIAEKLSYKAIVSNIPFICYVAVLCVFYISNSHHSIEIQRDINDQNKALKELRWKFTDAKSQLLQVKTVSAVRKKGHDIGLELPVMPAYKINIK